MKSLLLAAALALAWCETPPPSPVPPPEPTPRELSCSDACDTLRRLGCEEGQPTDEGATCEMVCENAAASPSPLPVACVTRAQSCELARGCE